MGNKNHTPGPWFVTPDFRIERVAHSSTQSFYYQVAIVPPCRLGDRMANARLIAAAPYLLQALKGVMELVGNQDSAICDMARGAIAQAEGGIA